jgi:hypothetical protein
VESALSKGVPYGEGPPAHLLELGYGLYAAAGGRAAALGLLKLPLGLEQTPSARVGSRTSARAAAGSISSKTSDAAAAQVDDYAEVLAPDGDQSRDSGAWSESR